MKISISSKPALVFLDEDELRQLDQTLGSTGITKEGSKLLFADSIQASFDRGE